MNAREEAGALLVGGGVDAAADSLEGGFDVEGGGKFRRPAKEHVLKEVGESGLARRIVAPADLDVEGQFGAVQVRHADGHNPQAVGEGDA